MQDYVAFLRGVERYGKGKVYALGHHDGSLCTQKQPETGF